MKVPFWVTALGATLAVQVVSSFASAVIPLLGPVITERWGLAPEDIGYVSATISVGICWFLACGSPALIRHGAVRTLQIGTLLLAVGMALLIQPLAWLGLVGALLVGLGLAPNTPAGSLILKRTAPVSHRTLIFSIKQAGVPLGGVLAGLVIAPWLGEFGFAGAILLVIAALVLCVVLVQPFRAALDAERSATGEPWLRTFLALSSVTKTVRVLTTHPVLPMLTALGMAFSFTQTCVTAFTATYMVTVHGDSLEKAGLYVAALLAASTVARIAFGWLADRLGGGLRLLPALAIAAGAAIVLLLCVAGGGSPLVYGAMVVVGGTCVGWNGVHMAELARAAPDDLIGEVTSGANLFGFAGAICGPIVFAVLADWTGGFTWPFLLAAGQLAAFGVVAFPRLTRAR